MSWKAREAPLSHYLDVRLRAVGWIYNGAGGNDVDGVVSAFR
jgi:hypothetical protein